MTVFFTLICTMFSSMARLERFRYSWKRTKSAPRTRSVATPIRGLGQRSPVAPLDPGSAPLCGLSGTRASVEKFDTEVVSNKVWSALVIPGLPHHVTRRGNRREKIFFDDGDDTLHLNLLAESSERARAQVWTYCLMPDHVHIIPVPGGEDGLRSTFANLRRRYSGCGNGICVHPTT